MKRLLGLVIVLFLGSSVFQGVNAKHIIGGDVTYECLGVDSSSLTATYKIFFTMYRDCASNGGAGFDESPQIGIYRGTGIGSYTSIGSINAPLLEINNLTIERSPCQDIPAGLCVEEGRYEFEIELPIISDSYFLSYQRCCRNVTINNIVNAEDTGASLA